MPLPEGTRCRRSVVEDRRGDEGAAKEEEGVAAVQHHQTIGMENVGDVGVGAQEDAVESGEDDSDEHEPESMDELDEQVEDSYNANMEVKVGRRRFGAPGTVGGGPAPSPMPAVPACGVDLATVAEDEEPVDGPDEAEFCECCLGLDRCSRKNGAWRISIWAGGRRGRARMSSHSSVSAGCYAGLVEEDMLWGVASGCHEVVGYVEDLSSSDHSDYDPEGD